MIPLAHADGPLSEVLLHRVPQLLAVIVQVEVVVKILPVQIQLPEVGAGHFEEGYSLAAYERRGGGGIDTTALPMPEQAG